MSDDTHKILKAVQARAERQMKKVITDKDYVADQAYVGNDPATALRQMWLLGRKYELQAIIDILDGANQ